MGRRAWMAALLGAGLLTAGCAGGAGSSDGEPSYAPWPRSGPSTPDGSGPSSPDATPPPSPGGTDSPTSALAPPGVDPHLVHDLTGGTSLRMLGVWGSTVVFASSDSRGRNTVQGKSLNTGEQTWSRTLEPQLGSSSNPSEMKILLQYGAVTVLESSPLDRLDRVARFTVIDPTTGVTRTTRKIGKYKSDGTFEPFGVLVEPWDRRIRVYLVDGRMIRMPDADKEWMLVGPEGTKPWIGSGTDWPMVERGRAGLDLEQVTENLAVRRHGDGLGERERGIQLIDTVKRKNVAKGCEGDTNLQDEVVVSPRRIWASVGGVAIDLGNRTLHCNPDIARRNGRVLAINDDGRMLGFTGVGTSDASYFLAEPDEDVQVLPVSDDVDSAFDPLRSDVAQTVALNGDRLVVQGRVFEVPATSS